MIDYIDIIPPLVQFLRFRCEFGVYGNRFPVRFSLPSVVIKNAGGTDYTRIQILTRALTDYEAMQILIEVMNRLEREASQVAGIRVIWCARETNPISTVNTESHLSEAWCYMRLEHMEG